MGGGQRGVCEILVQNWLIIFGTSKYPKAHFNMKWASMGMLVLVGFLRSDAKTVRHARTCMDGLCYAMHV